MYAREEGGALDLWTLFSSSENIEPHHYMYAGVVRLYARLKIALVSREEGLICDLLSYNVS